MFNRSYWVVNPKPSERKVKYGQEERIKMTRLRQTIAKRLKQAQENAALLTTFNEVDIKEGRDQYFENILSDVEDYCDAEEMNAEVICVSRKNLKLSTSLL